MLIRAYDLADTDELIALFRGSVRTVARRDYTHDQVLAWAPDEIDREEWAARRASRLTWVSVIAGKLVGFIDLESTGHIDMLYVHADYQGRGVARTLLQTTEVAARDQQLKRIHTEASITARPFFELHGFSIIAQQTVTVRGQDLINFRMEKEVHE